MYKEVVHIQLTQYTQWNISHKMKCIESVLITHIYGIYQNGTEEFIYRATSGETDIENRLMHVGRGEERVRCMERVTWKLTLPHVK